MKRTTGFICVAVTAFAGVIFTGPIDAQDSVHQARQKLDFDYYSTGSSRAKPQSFDVNDWIETQDESSPSDIIPSPEVEQNSPAEENNIAPDQSMVKAQDVICVDPYCSPGQGGRWLGQTWLGQCLWQSHCIEIGGWVQAGYSNDSTGLYNTHTGRVNLHQTWLFAERQRNECCGWDWGFRLDGVYGVDAQNTQAFGNQPGTYDFQNGFDHGIYGWALPQAFVDVGYGNVSVKLGHFFSMMGYERVQAPQNFFFSRSYASVLSQPQTLTGIVAEYDAGSTDWFAGWTTGWDTGFDQFNGSNAFIGGFKSQVTDSSTLGYTTTIGDFGRRGEGYAHSLMYEHQLNCRLTTVVQTNMVDADGTGFENDEFGLSNYWLYGINHWMDVGTRIEWWKSDINAAGSQSTYGWTSGFNIHPTQNLVIRPELRYNWGAQFNGAAVRQPIFGLDLIWAF